MAVSTIVSVDLAAEGVAVSTIVSVIYGAEGAFAVIL